MYFFKRASSSCLSDSLVWCFSSSAAALSGTFLLHFPFINQLLLLFSLLLITQALTTIPAPPSARWLKNSCWVRLSLCYSALCRDLLQTWTTRAVESAAEPSVQSCCSSFMVAKTFTSCSKYVCNKAIVYCMAFVQDYFKCLCYRVDNVHENNNNKYEQYDKHCLVASKMTLTEMKNGLCSL